MPYRAFLNDKAIFQQVPYNMIGSVWHHIEPLLAKALTSYARYYTPESVARSLASQDYQPWLLQDVKTGHVRALIITTLTRYDTGLLAGQVLFAGADNAPAHRMDATDANLIADALLEWSMRNGASELQYLGREGWLRWVPRFVKQGVSATIQIAG